MTIKPEIAEWEDDPWYSAITKCDRLLEFIIPGYEIVQIKSKFDSLRFYYSLPAGYSYDSPEFEIAQAIVRSAEFEAGQIELMQKWEVENRQTDLMRKWLKGMNK